MDLFAPSHLVVILILALLIFGPRRLPEMGKALGKAIQGFKEASREFQSSLETEVKREPEQKVAASPVSAAATTNPTVDSPAAPPPRDTA